MYTILWKNEIHSVDMLRLKALTFCPNYNIVFFDDTAACWSFSQTFPAHTHHIFGFTKSIWQLNLPPDPVQHQVVFSRNWTLLASSPVLPQIRWYAHRNGSYVWTGTSQWSVSATRLLKWVSLIYTPGIHIKRNPSRFHRRYVWEGWISPADLSIKLQWEQEGQKDLRKESQTLLKLILLWAWSHTAVRKI